MSMLSTVQAELQKEQENGKLSLSQIRDLEQVVKELRGLVVKMQTEANEEKEKIRNEIRSQIESEFQEKERILLSENHSLSERIKDLIALQTSQRIKLSLQHESAEDSTSISNESHSSNKFKNPFKLVCNLNNPCSLLFSFSFFFKKIILYYS